MLEPVVAEARVRQHAEQDDRESGVGEHQERSETERVAAEHGGA